MSLVASLEAPNSWVLVIVIGGGDGLLRYCPPCLLENFGLVILQVSLVPRAFLISGHMHQCEDSRPAPVAVTARSARVQCSVSRCRMSISLSLSLAFYFQYYSYCCS